MGFHAGSIWFSIRKSTKISCSIFLIFYIYILIIWLSIGNQSDFHAGPLEINWVFTGHRPIADTERVGLHWKLYGVFSLTFRPVWGHCTFLSWISISNFIMKFLVLVCRICSRNYEVSSFETYYVEIMKLRFWNKVRQAKFNAKSVLLEYNEERKVGRLSKNVGRLSKVYFMLLMLY